MYEICLIFLYENKKQYTIKYILQQTKSHVSFEIELVEYENNTQ